MRGIWACLNVKVGGERETIKIIGRLKLLKPNENLGFRVYFFNFNKDAWGGSWIWVFGGRKLMVLSWQFPFYLWGKRLYHLLEIWREYETVFKTVERSELNGSSWHQAWDIWNSKLQIQVGMAFYAKGNLRCYTTSTSRIKTERKW